jgi:hypothetical protein
MFNLAKYAFSFSLYRLIPNYSPFVGNSTSMCTSYVGISSLDFPLNGAIQGNEEVLPLREVLLV